jgi:phosphohistidine phosphatase SixA
VCTYSTAQGVTANRALQAAETEYNFVPHPSPSASTMPAAGRRIAVLVVGHEPMLRETYAMLFERAGYISEHAELGSSPARLKAINLPYLLS